MESKPKLILVVEDAHALRNDIVDTLIFEGFEAKGAENGLIGVQMAQEFPPDLVICDIMMPELDGYGVLKELRKNKSLAATPFVFLTAKTDTGDVKLGIEMGADDYITKPFTTDDLLLRIQTVLARREMLISKSLPLTPMVSLANLSHHIFLSYSRQDEDVMRKMRSHLRGENFTVWVDEDGLEPGTRSWRRAVQHAIDRAGCMVVILSPDAKQSQWVEAELDYAESQNKTIFPILASGHRSDAVPFGYTLAHWINIQDTKKYNSEMQKLVTAIRKLLHLT